MTLQEQEKTWLADHRDRLAMTDMSIDNLTYTSLGCIALDTPSYSMARIDARSYGCMRPRLSKNTNSPLASIDHRRFCCRQGRRAAVCYWKSHRSDFLAQERETSRNGSKSNAFDVRYKAAYVSSYLNAREGKLRTDASSEREQGAKRGSTTSKGTYEGNESRHKK